MFPVTGRTYAAIAGARAAHPDGTFSAREIARRMRADGATLRARITPIVTVYLRPSLTMPGRWAWCAVIGRDTGRYVIDGWVVIGDGSTVRGKIALAGGRS